MALLLHPPQPLDFASIVVSVIGEVTSPVDSGVIEFRKMSMDLAATVGDGTLASYQLPVTSYHTTDNCLLFTDL